MKSYSGRQLRLTPDEYVAAFGSAIKKAAENKYKAVAIPVVSDALYFGR
jgi:hypothetical protein